MSGREFIQLPGPTNVPDRVLEAFRRPIIDFAGPAFQAILEDVWSRLREVFDHPDHIVCYISNGHGAWEATLRNIARPGQRLLLADTGMFSSRWGDMVQGLGFKLDLAQANFRTATDVDAVRSVLAMDVDHEIQALLVAQTETSTGVRSDLGALRGALDEVGHPALLIVDAIASLGTEELPLGPLGVDVMITASQKGLMMPPGLSFCGISEKAFQRPLELHELLGAWVSIR